MYSMMTIMYLEAAKRVNHKSSHHKHEERIRIWFVKDLGYQSCPGPQLSKNVLDELSRSRFPHHSLFLYYFTSAFI